MASLKDELLFLAIPQVHQVCGPLFFTRTLETADAVTANGSFGLVDTGRKKLLITCWHVWNQFEEDRREHPELKMAICLDHRHPIVFAPEKPIDADSRLDLATFDMEKLLPVCDGRQFFPLHQNPAPRVSPRTFVLFVGFPGRNRRPLNGGLAFGRQPYAVEVKSVDDWRFHVDVSAVRKHPDDFPGFSGCPGFRVRKGRPIQLVGFATRSFMEFVEFTHARCLNPDGTISRCPHGQKGGH